MADQSATATIEIGGVEYPCRDHRYSATVLQLADKFSVTIPAPDGKVFGTPVLKVANMGDAVAFYLSDPAVQGGKKIQKLTGRVTGRSVRSDSGGCVLSVTGADLGWHLSSCAPVFKNERGLTWLKFAEKLLGLTVDPATGAVTADPNGWGIAGIGSSNLVNRKLRLGRQAAEIDYQQRAAPHTSLLIPRIQAGIGDTLDGIAIRLARLDGFLVNVSTDGWIQIFRPAWDGQTLFSDGTPKPYTAPVQYTFTHPGDIIKDTLSFDEDAANLYTHVECWNTVIDTSNNDRANPNAGNYHGTFDTNVDGEIGQNPFAFTRRYTFSDPEQYGLDPVTHASRVKARAKWQWQRFAFDAQTISFEVQGHSQNGIPYVEDSLASFKSSLLALDGTYYIAAVEPYRKLARAGFDSGAGTRCKITLKRSGYLGA